jgi:hypothetical protein
MKTTRTCLHSVANLLSINIHRDEGAAVDDANDERLEAAVHDDDDEEAGAAESETVVAAQRR